MEREKMIEEIARIICENENPCSSCLKCTIYDGKICCKYLRIAEKIVNLLIPAEGVVMLTKEEYERLKSDRKIKVVQHLDDEFVIEIPQCEYDEMLDQVRKETVTNFFKDLIRQANFHGETDMWFNYERLVTVAKQHGAEVKE